MYQYAGLNQQFSGPTRTTGKFLFCSHCESEAWYNKKVEIEEWL